jgi:hypothetical protein
MHAEIQRLVGNASCRDDTQCRALAMGSKPCGGPESYMAWSTAVTSDARALDAAAQRYKEARQARNQRLGLVSDCSVIAEPTMRCVPTPGDALGGRCQAVSRGGPTLQTR